MYRALRRDSDDESYQVLHHAFLHIWYSMGAFEEYAKKEAEKGAGVGAVAEEWKVVKMAKMVSFCCIPFRINAAATAA